MKNGNFGGIIWDGWGLKGYFSLDKVNEYLWNQRWKKSDSIFLTSYNRIMTVIWWAHAIACLPRFAHKSREYWLQSRKQTTYRSLKTNVSIIEGGSWSLVLFKMLAVACRLVVLAALVTVRENLCNMQPQFSERLCACVSGSKWMTV
jgi:hypothetical protein